MEKFTKKSGLNNFKDIWVNYALAKNEISLNKHIAEATEFIDDNLRMNEQPFETGTKEM